MTRSVIAGLDGSPESLAAADWAAREALRRELPLRLVHAWQWQPSDPATTTDNSAHLDPERHWAERIPREAGATLRARYPGLSVTADQIAAQPVPALLSAAENAELLVLGSRGLSSLAGYLVGSVSQAVVARTTCPVVMVRAARTAADEHLPEESGSPADDAPYRDVVLGLDLVKPSDTLLGFAFEAAAARSATLRVVHGWLPPAIYGYSPSAMAPDLSTELAGQEMNALTAALRPWREKFPAVRVVAESAIGPAAHHLVEAAGQASLVVVGRRTPRPGPGPHVGSVTHALLHHSPAPVAVVPHD
ncbi:universal stress protein [Streptomyces sp. NBC_01476]|uniref:universal stress protein n=1 Tax=Streptomyces sp. NBC_01476 TaxID=2903881 RepID=UPI002E2F5B42|nr:universal stress protein [Streptomyces sp. NBC_01476]